MDLMAQTELERKLFDLSGLLNPTPKPRRRPTPKKYHQNVEVKQIMNDGDRGTCAAVAYAHAFDVDYDTALEILLFTTDLRPRKGGGTNPVLYGKLLATKGWKYHKASGHLGKIDLTKLPKRCIIHTSRHVVACIEGVLHDQFVTHEAAGCKLIKGYWAPI